MADLRDVALGVLQDVLSKKNPTTKDVLVFGEEDNAFLTMLTLTALRKLNFLKQIIKMLVSKKIAKQNVVAQAALVLGATELLYMQTPDYAVINSYVNLTKSKTDKFVAGFVNAVLRKIAARKSEFLETDKGEFFPQAFRTLLRKSYSAKVIARIEKESVKQPCLDISCIDSESAIKLGGELLPLGTIRINAKGKINLMPDYDKGTWWVQDFSSALPVKMLGDVQGKKVLELCAAPGGKTAQLLAKGAKVTCVDISEERLNVLRENLTRLKMSPEKIVCGDGIEFLENCSDKYDVVLLDAPCSATGTLRRHPEIVHLKTFDDVNKQAELQRKFLDKVDGVLKNDGVLVYCTCSLCKEEGEEQMEYFLEKNPNYKIENLKNMIGKELEQAVTNEGFIRMLPQVLTKQGGADGFFVACLKKGREDVF